MTTKAGLLKSLLVLLATSLALGASAKDPPAAAHANWNATIEKTDGGHLIGNPDAEVKLVEFMSYTCSHCADFARDGDGALKLFYIPTGKVSFEIRHLVRDQVDLTIAMLTHCGDTKKFMLNHEAFTTRFPQWMAVARSATPAQQSRWQFGTQSARAQAIASDLGFYEIMESRGYGRTEVDKCLTDEAKARAIAETSRADIAKYDLKGTPTFLVDGKVVRSAYDWGMLRPLIDSAMQPAS